MTVEINFTSDEIGELQKSPWLIRVAERKQRALLGDPTAAGEISRQSSGIGREKILGWFDTGQLNLHHLQEGRQPDQGSLPRKGLRKVTDELDLGICPEPILTVNLRGDTKRIIAAVRDLVIAAIMRETGRVAIETGLIEEDSDARTLEGRTLWGGVEEMAKRKARERYDLSDDLRYDSFNQYLDLELMQSRGERIDLDGEGIDVHMVKVAVEHELTILRQLLSAYENVDSKDDRTETMLKSAKEITIPALESLRSQIAERLEGILKDTERDAQPETEQELERRPGCIGWLAKLLKRLQKLKFQRN